MARTNDILHYVLPRVAGRWAQLVARSEERYLCLHLRQHATNIAPHASFPFSPPVAARRRLLITVAPGEEHRLPHGEAYCQDEEKDRRPPGAVQGGSGGENSLLPLHQDRLEGILLLGLDRARGRRPGGHRQLFGLQGNL